MCARRNLVVGGFHGITCPFGKTQGHVAKFRRRRVHGELLQRGTSERSVSIISQSVRSTPSEKHTQNPVTGNFVLGFGLSRSCCVDQNAAPKRGHAEGLDPETNATETNATVARAKPCRPFLSEEPSDQS